MKSLRIPSNSQQLDRDPQKSEFVDALRRSLKKLAYEFRDAVEKCSDLDKYCAELSVLIPNMKFRPIGSSRQQRNRKSNESTRHRKIRALAEIAQLLKLG